LLLGATARGQEATCGPDARVPFAGHSFPTDSSPVLIDAFPALSFTSPVFVTAAPGAVDGLAVVEQGGRVLLFPNDPLTTIPSVFLDLSQSSPSFAPVLAGGEEGLLGLAFDPDFASNAFVYVNYTVRAADCGTPTDCSRVVRFRATSNGGALQADVRTARTILQFPQPFANHKSGMLAFGPDGMLWIGSGDGGGTGDPQNSGQRLNTLLGKLLRIDVHHGLTYMVPLDNPFTANPGARPEIFALGLRDPWRFSFDRVTGDLWLGDVGESQREEVDRIPFGDPGGQNFGWKLCEGTSDFSGTGCATAGLTPPVLEYAHDASGGRSITGGYVYRGAELPGLYGKYIYADYLSGRIWAWDPAAGGEPQQIATRAGVSSFGEDRNGNLFVVGHADGRLRRFAAAGGPLDPRLPQTLSATGLFADLQTLTPAPGVLEYAVNVPAWTDFGVTRHWLALPADGQIAFSPTGDWSFPVGTALVQHIELPISEGEARVETRVLVRGDDGWRAYTYWWRPDRSDADLITGGALTAYTVDLGSGSQLLDWRIPSSTECLDCHTPGAGVVLGARTRQINRLFETGTSFANQLDGFACLALFDAPIGTSDDYPRFAPSLDDSQPVDRRARAYLDVNCASCHQPGGQPPAGMDLRFDTAFDATQTLDVPATLGNLGIPDARRIKAGNHVESVLYARVASADPAVHMPRRTLHADPEGSGLLAAWIDAGLPQQDTDGDGIDDSIDVCPSVPDPFQLDFDGDGVGDACDNCVDMPNPRMQPGEIESHPWEGSTGGQRDDDGDGFGNRCDAKFGRGRNVSTSDLAAFRASVGHAVNAMDCGINRNIMCAPFDLDDQGMLIDDADLEVLRELFAAPPGPTCPTCPLACAGTACSSSATSTRR
jgi:uncharacterized repeat protein (TIGR03806 family)